jgi:hypothetical protein
MRSKLSAAVRGERAEDRGQDGREAPGGRGRPFRARAIVVLATAAAVVVTAIVLGGGTATAPHADETCLQRVKVWSPSRQATVMRLQNFCS